MTRGSALLLQVLTVIVGMCILALMLWEPHLEGRNAQATPFEIYFKDPFLAYVYAGSFPFFVAVHRAFGLFGDVRRNGRFSPATLNALRTIQRSALVLIGFIAGAAFFIVLFGDADDRPAGIFMCALATLFASALAFAATTFARHVQRALTQTEGFASKP